MFTNMFVKNVSIIEINYIRFAYTGIYILLKLLYFVPILYIGIHFK